MNEKITNRKKIKNLVVVSSIIIAILFFVLKINSQSNTIKNEDNIKQILNSNLIFQNSVGVGSSFSGLYNFNEDGTFIFSDKEIVRNNNQVLFIKGSWKYSNGILELIVQQEYKSLNGIMTNDVILGEILEDYTVEKSTLERIEKYNIKLNLDDGFQYIDGDLVLYEVHLTEEEKKQYFNESDLNK